MKMIMFTRNVRGSEAGFASLVVGLILIVVLGLLTVGFAQLSRHEQIQALDSELSNEAYYAAESGINDAVADILTTNAADKITSSTPNVDSGNCMGAFPNYSSTLNSTDDVYYTCVLIYLNPPQLEYGPVVNGTGHTVVVTAVNPNTNGPMTNMTFAWGSADGQTTYAPWRVTKQFESFGAWTGAGYPGVIELTITPLLGVVAGGNLTTTRDQLTQDAFTVFLYPSTNGGNTVIYNTGDDTADGDVKPGACAARNAPYDCSVTINNISPSPTGQYLIHFYDLYDESNVKITGTDGAGAVDFTGGQAQIDVTGRAQDVLKRLAVTIPLGSDNYPQYAIQARDLCKKIETAPVTAKDPTPTSFWDPTGANTTAAAPCNLEL